MKSFFARCRTRNNPFVLLKKIVGEVSASNSTKLYMLQASNRGPGHLDMFSKRRKQSEGNSKLIFPTLRNIPISYFLLATATI